MPNLKEVLTDETYSRVCKDIQRACLNTDRKLALSYIQGMVDKFERETSDKINKMPQNFYE